MDWPSSTLTTGPTPDPDENRYFTIEGKVRNHYIDFANHIVQQFFSQILNQVPEEHPGEPEKQYETAIAITDRYNQVLDEMGLGFLQFRIIDRTSQRSHPYYGIQLHGLDATAFEEFLEKAAGTNEASLEEKYHYLRGAKYPALEVESKSRSPRTESRQHLQEAVKARVSTEKASLTETIDELLANINAWREELQTYWRRKLWQHFNTFPAVHFYLLEMESIITNIEALIKRGSIPPCYREMRKLLENLSWAIFDDLLFINADYAKVYSENPSFDRAPPRPFLNANQQWYEWNRGQGTLDFEEQRGALRDQLVDHCNQSQLNYDHKYGVTEAEITEVLKEELSYPLYITLLGIPIDDPAKVESFVEPVSTTFLEPFVQRTLRNALRSAKGDRRLGKLDKEFITRISDELLDTGHNYVVPPFPSNNQVIGYLDNLWHQELTRPLDSFYSEYSFFIHSYPSSWQLFPHSSILEFKILDVELDRFSHAITELIERYLTDLHRH